MDWTLRDLIEFLESKNPEVRLVLGLGAPDSYRGYYERLAFPLERSVTIGEMLSRARAAVGRTFEGYKGGSFEMGLDTFVYVAGWGNCGSELSWGLMEELFKFQIPSAASPSEGAGK